ncbi:MAG: hypothetical protein ACRDHZ_21735, partial [Ktedonobacteraceae bacterium]
MKKKIAQSRKNLFYHVNIEEKLQSLREEQNRAQEDDGPAMVPEHVCLHQFFEQQVARVPEAIALVQG